MQYLYIEIQVPLPILERHRIETAETKHKYGF